jgi:hypothetical protein
MTIDELRTKSGMITLLELDRVPALADSLELSVDHPEQRFMIDEVTKKLTTSLSPHVSGMMFSAQHSFGYRSQIAKNLGVGFSLEKKTAAVDPLIPPQLLEGWGGGKYCKQLWCS